MSTTSVINNASTSSSRTPSYHISHPLIRSAHTYINMSSTTADLPYGVDFSKWYEINTDKVHPAVLERLKVHHYDDETREFLSDACNIPYYKHVFDNAMSIFLIPFMSSTSRNGVLNRGLMYVAGKALFEELLEYSADGEKKEGSLLDVGAGDGNVTRKLEHMFSEIYCTETSSPMRYRLNGRGYTVVEVENWMERTYDVIACLNVLDRCSDPYKLLHDMYDNLKINGGKCIIALVLPYNGAVESGQEWISQKRPLKIRGSMFEEQVSSFIIDVLQPIGFELIKLTKIPYICYGDLNAMYYSLDDCLMSLNVPKCGSI